jgi:hypothetical protein
MLDDDDPARVDFAPGDSTGLDLPAHAQALRVAGAQFLTAAFRRFGSLSPDNHVQRVTRIEPFAGGNSGQKLLLSVEYGRQEPGLHTDLFVKFSRDFTDAFRDRRRHELEAEVRLAELSRRTDFPIQVPVAYFADYHRSSGTGLLITQQIAFGRGSIEPLHAKCMDHQLSEPLVYYRTIVSTLARLAAADQSGRLSPQVDVLFPFDLPAAIAADPIRYGEAELRERVGRYAAFAAAHPRLLPPHVVSSGFVAQLERDAVRFLRHEIAIKRFLHSRREFVALCHYNANIDNAWFWRDRVGAVHCGLLDWGRVRRMNVAYALWGSLCGASLQLWDRHLDELLHLFADELCGHGGPRLQIPEIRLHLHCYVATMGLATMMDVPALVLARLPEAASAAGPLDPILFRDPVVSGFLHVFTAFLNLWQTHDFGASLDRLLHRLGLDHDTASRPASRQ